jgi:hypothetical protein
LGDDGVGLSALIPFAEAGYDHPDDTRLAWLANGRRKAREKVRELLRPP